jgi:hypothetical protein
MIDKLSVFRTSLVISLLTFCFIVIAITPVYKSKSIIDIAQDKNESFSIATSLLSSNNSSEAFQVKLYLESNELSELYKSSYDVEELFANKNISYFSRYKENFFSTFHKYFQKKINVIVDADSDTLIIETFAYTPESAKNINLQLINITANFFNRKSRLAALNDRSSKFCELYFTNAGIINANPPLGLLRNDSLKIIDESLSANDLLSNKAKSFQDFCISEFNMNKNINGQIVDIPDYELRTINAEASKKIIGDIYMTSMSAIAEVDYMQIIAEPVISTRPESRKALILSLLSFVFSTITLVSIKIIYRLSNEFKT